MTNPFDDSIWEGTRRLRANEDVASLNSAASDRLLQQIELVRGDHRSRCSLLLGQPGLGKSHVLARVVEHGRSAAYPIVVRRYALPNATFRNLFRQVVWALHEQRLADDWSMLDDLLFHSLRLTLESVAVARFNVNPEGLAELPGHEAYAMIRSRLDRELVDACVARYESVVRKSWGQDELLPAYLHDLVQVGFLALLDETRPYALRWLRGRDLDEDDLARLGLARSVDCESRAQEALTTLALFARSAKPIALCFDQTERLESTPEERGINALGRAIAFLRELPSLSMVFSCLKDRWLAYAQELPSSARDRIAREESDIVELAYPTPDEGVEIVRRRLGGDPAPFVERNVWSWVDRFGPSVRRLLQECAVAFWRWRGAGEDAEILLDLEAAQGVAQAPSPAPDDAARDRGDWELALRAAEPVSSLDANDTSEAMSIVLNDIHLTVGGRALTPLSVRKGSPLQQCYRAGRQTVGFLFDETRNGNSFAARAKKLLKLLAVGQVGHLFVWRTEPIKRTWKAGGARWAELTAHPRATVCRPDPETLRRLAAFRNMCSTIQSAGRDHHETANQLFGEALGERAEIREVLRVIGARGPEAPARGAEPALEQGVAVAGAPAVAAPPISSEPNLRDLIRARLNHKKILSEIRLVELLEKDLARAPARAVVHSALEDLEASGVIWRLKAGKDGHVLALC